MSEHYLDSLRDWWWEDFRKPNAELRLKESKQHGALVPYREGHFCTRCGKHISEDDVVGPINIVIRDPEFIGPEGIEREFCTWECLADWAAIQAGRKPPARDPEAQ